MLWKKDSTEKGAMYVNCFAKIDSGFDDIFLQSKPIPKSNVISSLLRQEGNVQFAERNWLNAIKAYNYALCFGENGSEDLSHAYANRSACFFELDQFESSQNDIHLALQTPHISDELMEMISQQQRDCSDFLEGSSNSNPPIIQPKMDFKPNLIFPAMADVLQYDATRSGHIITANCDIDVGQKIYVEKSPVSKLLNDKFMRCTTCLARNNNLIPCHNCTRAMFCSDECSGSILHEAECSLNEEIEGDGKLAFLTRTVLYAISLFNNVDELMDFVALISKSKQTPTADEQAKYQQFFRMKFDRKHTMSKTVDALIYFAYNTVMASTVGHLFATEKQRRFLMHLTLQHEAIISFGNVHQYTDETDQAEHLCIFPTFSQFKHSCTPNAMRFMMDNWSVIVTVRPIKKGEEITVSYYDKKWFNGTDDERHDLIKRIQKNHRRKCRCDLCDSQIATPEERNAMQESSSYQSVMQAIDDCALGYVPANPEETILKATEFLHEFGRSKWCDELNHVITCFVDMIWLQCHSGH